MLQYLCDSCILSFRGLFGCKAIRLVRYNGFYFKGGEEVKFKLKDK